MSELFLSVDSLRYNSISSASFSEKSDILDSLSELTFSWPRKASSVAYFLTYSTIFKNTFTQIHFLYCLQIKVWDLINHRTKHDWKQNCCNFVGFNSDCWDKYILIVLHISQITVFVVVVVVNPQKMFLMSDMELKELH